MTLRDALGIFSSAQSVTGSVPVIGTDVIDRLAVGDIGAGTQLYAGFLPTTALATPYFNEAVTASNSTNVINLNAHGLTVGTKVYLAGTTAPTGLTLRVPYWVTNPTTNAFQVASTLANALAGTPVTFATDGAGLTLTVIPEIEIQVVTSDAVNMAGSDALEVIASTGRQEVRVRQLCTFTAGSTLTVNRVAHGLPVGTPVVLGIESGGDMPTGLTAGTRYFVTNIAADSFQLAASLELARAGQVVSFSTTGTNPMHYTVDDGLFATGRRRPLFLPLMANPSGLPRRYIGVRYVPNRVSAGAFTSWLALAAEQDQIRYPSGWSV